MGLLHHQTLHMEAPHLMKRIAHHHHHHHHHVHVGAHHHVHALARMPQRWAPQVHHLNWWVNKRVGASHSKQAASQLRRHSQRSVLMS